MAQEKIFRITLTNEFNNDFIILPNDMIGWDSLKIVLERDYDTFGFNQFFEGSFTFVAEGRRFIIDLYNQYFVEAKIQFKIEVLMPNANSSDYITIGIGRLNLAELSQKRHLDNRELAEEETDAFLELSCKIDMSGFAQNIKNNNEKLFDVTTAESIEGQSLLEYPLDKFGFELPLHSKTLALEAEIQGGGGYNVHNDLNPIPGGSELYYSYNLELDNIVIDEFIEAAITTPTILADKFDVINGNNDNEVDGTPNTEQELFASFISNSTQTYNITITGTITLGVNSPNVTDKYFYLYIWDSESENVVLIETAFLPGDGIDNKSVDFSQDFYLPVGTEVKIWARIEVGGAASSSFDIIQMVHTLNVNISSETLLQSTSTKSYLIYELLDKCLSFNTSKNDRLRSSFYGRIDSFPRTYTGENTPSFLAITNGALVRLFPDYQNVTTSLKRILEDLQAIHCIGWSVENETGDISDPQNLRVEFIDYFFQDEVIHNFVNPDDLNFQVATFLLQNRYEFGYKKYEDDFESTIDDPHTERQYNNHLTAVNNGVSYLSELIASSYALENARRQSFIEKPKQSFKYDTDNFVIQGIRAQFKVNIVGFDVDKILIRRGSVIADLATFTSYGIVGCTIYNAGANDGIYNVTGYEEVGNPDDAAYEQKIVLNAFVAVPLDLQADSYALISTDQSKFFPEQDQTFEVQNLIDPSSAYNLRITPNRNLMRWFRLWKTSFYKFPAQFFKFVQGIQNYKLITNGLSLNTQFEDGGDIAENQNFVASDNKQAILPPSTITFNHPLDIETFSFFITSENRYKKYTVTTDNGKTVYTGFLDKISYQPYDQLAEITLIAELGGQEIAEPMPDPDPTPPLFPCNSILESGGEGVTTTKVELDPNGGIVVFGINTFVQPDKVEGMHNGIKVFTSGMFGIDNTLGPFDDDVIQDDTPPQYIGSIKGVIPNRIAEFEAETGYTIEQFNYQNSGYKQLVWFEYTAADYLDSDFMTIVVTGYQGTIWTLKRFCLVEEEQENIPADFLNQWTGKADDPGLAAIVFKAQEQVNTLNLSNGDSIRVQVFYGGVWYDETKTVYNTFGGGFGVNMTPNFSFVGIQMYIGTVLFARARNITKGGAYVDLGIQIPGVYPP